MNYLFEFVANYSFLFLKVYDIMKFTILLCKTLYSYQGGKSHVQDHIKKGTQSHRHHDGHRGSARRQEGAAGTVHHPARR